MSTVRRTILTRILTINGHEIMPDAPLKVLTINTDNTFTVSIFGGKETYNTEWSDNPLRVIIDRNGHVVSVINTPHDPQSTHPSK